MRKLDFWEQKLADRGCFSVLPVTTNLANFIKAPNSGRVARVEGQRTIRRRTGAEKVWIAREWFPAAKRWAKTPTYIPSEDTHFATLDDLERVKLVKIDKKTGVWCPPKPRK